MSVVLDVVGTPVSIDLSVCCQILELFLRHEVFLGWARVEQIVSEHSSYFNKLFDSF